MGPWMQGWMDGCRVDRWTNNLIVIQTDEDILTGALNGQMDGWIDGWMDWWMGAWIESIAITGMDVVHMHQEKWTGKVPVYEKWLFVDHDQLNKLNTWNQPALSVSMFPVDKQLTFFMMTCTLHRCIVLFSSESEFCHIDRSVFFSWSSSQFLK